MLEAKKSVFKVCIVFAVLVAFGMLIVLISYTSIDETTFSIDGARVRFNDLTYGDLKQFDVPSGTIYIVVDGEDQIDVTTCDYDSSTNIKSITAIVKNASSLCNFSVYGVSIGGSADSINAMPKETEHSITDEAGVQISRYVDKDENVIIIGTDTELGIISYITIRSGNQN